ncbi:glycosyl transferase [Massilia glaciei]|uniref:Glycosyl transferase n=1 Tax=Massilia glaciei TaxID=1524097 RepID=A0A2U2HMK5_9BURK|nr:glycosyl transferase [Massilia glaciei]
MYRIAHLTSAHPRYDTRIFVKQCRSLAAHGHEVTLVVADDGGDAERDGVRIVDVGRLHGRVNRMLRTTRRVFDQALALDAEVYHLHDPELIPTGLKLKRLGKKVVFDAHEDVPSQLLAKPYLGRWSRQVAASSFSVFERYACCRFDGIVAATPFIRDKFLPINARTVDINNFPVIGEFDAAAPWSAKSPQVCYVGSIAAIRGIRELLGACTLLRSPTRLALAGAFSESALESEMHAHPGWVRIDALGHLDRDGVGTVMAASVAGLVTLHPVVNYLDALPVKMFEYMAAGIPVIASDFPVWRAIIEHSGCGVCVDPADPRAIAAAIDYFIANPGVAERMGQNGRRAVTAEYNWQCQSSKLISFYDAL